jgi:hypothetical protein
VARSPGRRRRGDPAHPAPHLAAHPCDPEPGHRAGGGVRAARPAGPPRSVQWSRSAVAVARVPRGALDPRPDGRGAPRLQRPLRPLEFLLLRPAPLPHRRGCLVHPLRAPCSPPRTAPGHPGPGPPRRRTGRHRCHPPGPPSRRPHARPRQRSPHARSRLLRSAKGQSLAPAVGRRLPGARAPHRAQPPGSRAHGRGGRTLRLGPRRTINGPGTVRHHPRPLRRPPGVRPPRPGYRAPRRFERNRRSPGSPRRRTRRYHRRTARPRSLLRGADGDCCHHSRRPRHPAPYPHARRSPDRLRATRSRQRWPLAGRPDGHCSSDHVFPHLPWPLAGRPDGHCSSDHVFPHLPRCRARPRPPGPRRGSARRRPPHGPSTHRRGGHRGPRPRGPGPRRFRGGTP